MSPDLTHLSILAMSAVVSGTAAPGLNTFTGVTSFATVNQVLAPSQWSSYIGLGGGTSLFTASFSQGSYTGQAPFLVFFSGQAEAGGAFKVRYDYDPVSAVVPAPATLPLLLAGAGILGLAGLRRRALAPLRGAGIRATGACP
jgi:hypothetical protein